MGVEWVTEVTIDAGQPSRLLAQTAAAFVRGAKNNLPIIRDPCVECGSSMQAGSLHAHILKHARAAQKRARDECAAAAYYM